MQAAARFIAGLRKAPTYSWTPVRTAQAKDESRLARLLTLAFADDPPTRWLFPEADRYRRDFPDFVRVFGGAAVELGTAYHVDGVVACALWLPPGEEPDEAGLVDFVESRFPAERQDEIFAVFEAMGRVHPVESHWYLPLIGVEPAFRGHGFGSALLRHILAVCDRDSIPAYLEATSARNAALYARHGFRALEPIQVGTCPPITPMWRAPSRHS